MLVHPLIRVRSGELPFKPFPLRMRLLVREKGALWTPAGPYVGFIVAEGGVGRCTARRWSHWSSRRPLTPG